MDMSVKRHCTPAWAKPYDPADSPGPIPSVLDSFRPGLDRPGEAEIEAARYTVVLVPPEAAEVFGPDRTAVGLRIYHDGFWAECPNGLDEAVRLIEEACGESITLVEHHSDLTYWTARIRDD